MAQRLLKTFPKAGRGAFMTIIYRVAITTRGKSKKQKKIAKTSSSASIAQRYMELRRLRERISEAESRLYAR
jgi:hypothetical protein